MIGAGDVLLTRGLAAINSGGEGHEAFGDAYITRGMVFLVHEITTGIQAVASLFRVSERPTVFKISERKTVFKVSEH